METYPASDAKREFGEVLLKSQAAPVSVTRNGKPVAVILSESDYQALKLRALRAALIEGERSGVGSGATAEDIKNIARKHVEQQ